MAVIELCTKESNSNSHLVCQSEGPGLGPGSFLGASACQRGSHMSGKINQGIPNRSVAWHRDFKTSRRLASQLAELVSRGFQRESLRCGCGGLPPELVV